jgi:hypothetical protein
MKFRILYITKLIFLFYLLPLLIFVAASLLLIPNSIERAKNLLKINIVEFIKLQVKIKKSSYNKTFLPNTQTGVFGYNVVKLTNDLSNPLRGSNSKYKFFIDIHDDDLYTINSLGNVYVTKLRDFLGNKADNSKIVQTNFDSNFQVLDFIVDNNIMIISAFKLENNCANNTLFIAELSDTFNFEGVNVSMICGKYANGNGLGGKIAKYKISPEGEQTLLMTIGFEDPFDEIINKKFTTFNDNSTSGKIILINLKKKTSKIFSKGHRNQIGLLVTDKDIVLATENGPFGGDEINKIKMDANYGWPAASYGIYYPPNWNYFINRDPGKLKYSWKYFYSKSHSLNSYNEPVYSFTPSIGISEIVEVPNDFSEKWIDNYLVASLNGKSLYKMKFNSQLTGVINIEQIYIGERIRDIVYSSKYKTFLLALEGSGSIGLLSNNQ